MFTMIGWIRDLIDRAPDVVGAIKDAIKRALGAVWSFLRTVFGHVDSAWDLMFRGAKALGGGLWDFAGDAYNAIKHVVTKVIPDAARWAFDKARTFTVRAVNTLRQWAANAIEAARRILARAINVVEDWARRAVRFLQRTLNGVIARLRYVAGVVRQLLTVPLVLARWVFAPLWRLIVRYIDDHAAAWGRWILGHTLKAVLWSANLVESIFARVI